MELTPLQGSSALTVDFEAGEAVFREVLVAYVQPAEAAAAQRIRKMIRAAVGLEKPPQEPGPSADRGPIDSFG